MQAYLSAFIVAIQFLTRIPVPDLFRDQQQDFSRATLFFPLVGLLVGVLLFMLQAILGDTSVLLQAALLLMVWVLITGNLHLDGLADTLDAWVGGMGDRDKTLAIMKDPTCGPSAVSGVVVLLLLKFAALVTLLEHDSLAIIAAPLLARAALLPWFVYSPYARPGGLATVFVENLQADKALLAAALAMVLSLLIGGTSAFVWIVVVAVVVWLLWRACMQRLGGVTGDTTGALIELVEAGVLVSAALML